MESIGIYICVFSIMNRPGDTLFCCTRNINKSLQELNSNSDSGSYSCYGYYLTNHLEDANVLLNKLFEKINPDLQEFPGMMYYKLSPKNAYLFLKYIASFTGTEDRLTLLVEEDIEYEHDAIPEADDGNQHLLENLTETVDSDDEGEPNLDDGNFVVILGMTKKKAKKIFSADGRKNNYKLFDTYTWASHNSSYDYYWANPHSTVLTKDWSLILNDNINGIMYLFNIPANSISRDEMSIRDDASMSDCLQMEVKYNDPQFRDLGSIGKKIAFKNYFVKALRYDGSDFNIDDMSSLVDPTKKIKGSAEQSISEPLMDETYKVISLFDEIDFVFKRPTRILFHENEYQVDNMIDLLMKSLQLFMDININKINDLLDHQTGPFERTICYSRNSYDLFKPIKTSYRNSEFYVNGRLTDKEILILLSFLANEIHVQPFAFRIEFLL